MPGDWKPCVVTFPEHQLESRLQRQVQVQQHQRELPQMQEQAEYRLDLHHKG